MEVMVARAHFGCRRTISTSSQPDIGIWPPLQPQPINTTAAPSEENVETRHSHFLLVIETQDTEKQFPSIALTAFSGFEFI